MGVVSSLIGGFMGSNEVNGARGDANAVEERQYQQARADLEPWRTTGSNALMAAGNLSGANGPDAASAAMANYQTSPGYQWQMDQGLRAVDAGAAAKGMARSGAAIKAEQTYGQGLANSDFSTYYNRLFNLSGQGLTAATTTGQLGSKMASDIAQTDTSAAATNASIYANTAKSIGNQSNMIMSGLG